MDENDLLRNETVIHKLSPHPLSFMMLQSLCLFLIAWGLIVVWLVNFSEVQSFFSSAGFGHWLVLVVWGLVMLAVGIAASIVSIRWSIFFMYLGIVIGGLVLTWQFNWNEETVRLFIPLYTIAIAIVGFLLVEVYRRSHKYVITNHRIVFSGGIGKKHERSLRYDKITEIAADQGILGQIFGFGTINTVSASGFGLGADQSFAAGGVEVGTKKKVGFMGLFGGGREVQTPRARTYYELHGVYPFKKVKQDIEELVQGHVITTYQKEQVDLQQQQLDLQKEMKSLLKLQVDEDARENQRENESAIPPASKLPSFDDEDDDHWYPRVPEKK